MRYRLGVDVGGTFTDILLIDQESGQTYRAKTPSTPHDQSIGVLAGIRKACAVADVSPDEIGEILHGTTVATNAILEGKGARVGLVTTAGFRQVLQIARSFVPGGLAGWIIWPKPEPLAALEDTVEAVERVAADGSVVTPLDEDDLRAKLRSLRGVEALAVSLINSFAFDGHERRIAELAAEELPGVPVSISSEVLPELREYERTVTTVANAYVQPRVARYLDNLGLDLYALRSDGGLASQASAKAAPVNMLLSGPAGGVAGATWVAEQAGFTDFLTFDMGGTSTDVALVQDARPRVGRETKVGDLTVRSASVDVRTVGAGGGSVAHVPELTRALRVGPQSAGAEPGPAAYGKGGTDPTVTDANVVLGYLPSRLAGGEIVLDRERSRAAVAQVADAMGLSVEAAAQGIVDIVNENMFGALRLVSVQQGFDPRDFALVAFGGAGPLHANALGRLTGSWPVIIPPSPGVLCAYGDATTCLRDEASRTSIKRFSQLTDDELRQMLTELAERAAATLEAEGVGRADQTVTYQVDVRYHGQGFEIPIDLGLDTGLEALGKAFDAEHERLFSFLLSNEHEVVSARASVSGPRPDVRPVRLDQGGPAAEPVDKHEVWIDGGWAEASIYDRGTLLAGDRIEGPAIVTEMDSTTLVLPGHVADVHESGSLLIRPLEA
ncbi:hydantoinase/oxoprolinase family protein [Nonomuraea harbinensis]|uniref:Hydantoinase/oxoprolinase family protein n=1 Tax=Nonomuraea harbinensis TaxID=1286938 RepID=A0ABW1C195_9ACTN|nr:hydantoinase/oxoprolinase family protein [Nonomuraea harbinensis]